MELETTASVRTSTIEDLYVRYAPAGFRLALLLTGDPSLAEDIVQDAFVRVVGRFGHLRRATSFDAYLRRTIVNLAKNTWRRRALERKHGDASVTRQDDVAPADAAVLERLVVLRLLASLSERQRTAIVLRFYEDLAEDDIAAIMRCPAGTVRSLISRAIAIMRHEIGDHEDG